MANPREVSALSNLALDIWGGFRPYLVKFLVDFMISGSLWVLLYLFKRLTFLLQIDGPAGEFITNLHAAGAVSAFGIFAVLFVIDLYGLHKEKASDGHR